MYIFFSDKLKRNLCATLLLSALTASFQVMAIVNVRMQTDLGAVDIELYDSQALLTVENFLNYVDDGDYNGTFFHRSVPDFVLQGGGYIFTPENGSLLSSEGDFTGNGGRHIPEDDIVVENDPDTDLRPNSRGTISMARRGGLPDSASSEWFFNLVDNQSLDDPQDPDGPIGPLEPEEPYTVFGRVLGNGMDIIDAIAANARCQTLLISPTLCGPASVSRLFEDLPLVGMSALLNGTRLVDDVSSTPFIYQYNLVNLLHIGRDSDGDGIADSLENEGANGGDADGDLTPDREQQDIASYRAISGDIVTLEASADVVLVSTSFMGKTFGYTTYNVLAPPAVIAGLDFIHGYLGFNLNNITDPGGATTVTLSFPVGSAPNTYYQFGPTMDDETDHWYEFLYDDETGTGAIITDNVITLHFVDGMRGDADLDDTNGSITTLGGPAIDLDLDNDGVLNAVEDNAPNDGDGNDDGEADSIQGHIASLLDAQGDYVILITDSLLSFTDILVQPVSFAANNGFPDEITDLFFAHGFFEYDVVGLEAGGATTVTLSLPVGSAPTTYYQFGPTLDDPTDHWYEFLYDDETMTGAKFIGNEVTLHFVDGKRGDADPDDTNGSITTLGGPAIDLDLDDDGISNAVEDGAPNDGDGNYDGIADSLQDNVISLPGIAGRYISYATVLPQLPQSITPSVGAFDPALDITNPETFDPPVILEGFNFSHFFFGFEIVNVGANESATLTLTLPEGESPVSYFKFGQTPDDRTDHWYEFLYDEVTMTGAKINDNVITLHFVNGERGDSDLDAGNGVIVDPGGPAFSAPNTGGSSGGGGGCSLRPVGSGPSQAGAWWVLLAILAALRLLNNRLARC